MLSRRILAATSRIAAARAPIGARFYSLERTGDTFDQSHQSGHAATEPRKASPVDAASPEAGKKANRDNLSGNPEGVGFADQVGSQSSSGSNMSGNGLGKSESAEGVNGKENITPPSFADAVKNKLGFKTTAGEDKQNRGGGKGVTGTGNPTFDRRERTMHTSAVFSMPAKTRGQAPDASKQPKDSTHADQNAHLKHKASAATPDQGKGAAAKDPKLPSHEVETKGYKRGFHTRAGLSQEQGESKHTADSYFKDVDDTKPVNPKVHQVDSSSGSGAPVARANEHPATGNFSRSGPGSQEYESTNKEGHPYDTPPTEGPEAEQKLRYGGQPGLSKPSKADEGPSGKTAGGRKPEGKR